MVSHLEPEILECEGKWTSGSTAAYKASGCNGISVELFKILKDDAINVLQSLCQQIWETQQWPQDKKKSILIPIPKKCSTKECSYYWTIVLISHAGNVCLKILHTKLHHYASQELLDVQFGFNDNPVCETAKQTQMYRTVFGTLWERKRVGRFWGMTLKHVYYHIRNESPVQLWYRVLGSSALGWLGGMVLEVGWEGVFRMGNTCMPMVGSCWCVAEPIQNCKVKKKEKKRKGRGTRDQIANICCIIEKAREFQKHLPLFHWLHTAFDCVDYNKPWKTLQEVRILVNLTCLLRNMYAGQDAKIRTMFGTIDWFRIEKEVR